MRALRFRVQNFRNIDDSGWIPLERVTAFVGRNESGKTSLLKALHKFNPATEEPYDPQREFPRDRFTRDYIAGGSDGGQWPVCSVEFAVPDDLKDEFSNCLEGQETPETVAVTRYYDESLSIGYSPELPDLPLTPEPVLDALRCFASSARRLEASDGSQEDATTRQRTELAQWANGWQEGLSEKRNLRNDEGAGILTSMLNEVEEKSGPETADMVEALSDAIRPIRDAAGQSPASERLNEIVKDRLPVFIYFANYGILDSAVWLPRFLDDLNSHPTNARVRTIDAMFKHVGLKVKDIARLGKEQPQETPEQVAEAQRLKEERAIKLNSASNDITKRFSAWWKQRRHQIRYSADGDYFRIWVADNRRPGVEIELEARSKGFQWFFSFYLVFLVESEDFHKEAILLLDEPGLHLHATAQQELLSFFESLSESNQLLYSTHSPFLVDGDHLHRVRAVLEDDAGRSRIAGETWPMDRETIFPLQAAAGYAIMRGLFRHQRNILVEGMSDFYYLHALSQQCVESGQAALPDDIYITPCGGTKYVGHIASLFLGHSARPVIILDGDDAGRARQSALMKELYATHGSGIVMLDGALNRLGDDVEIEDLLGEAVVLRGLRGILGRDLAIDEVDRRAGSLPRQIKAAAVRQGVELPAHWKARVSRRVVMDWAEGRQSVPPDILESATSLFSAIADASASIHGQGSNP